MNSPTTHPHPNGAASHHPKVVGGGGTKGLNVLYVAGPMSNLPGANYNAFHCAAAQLRALGYVVENPAENPEPYCGTWLGYMRMALTQLARCDGVVLLVGWEQSVGADIEAGLALKLGLPVMSLADAFSSAPGLQKV